MLQLCLKTVFIYFLVIFSFRLMGKRQISQLQPNELVITLLISELAIMPIQDDIPLFSHGIIPMLVLVFLEILISFIMIKNGKIRKIICGSPVIVISDGKILQNELRKQRISIEDLFSQLRNKDVFNIDEIKYAIVETDGRLSVLRKKDFDTVCVSDLNLQIKDEDLKLVVISDGEICKHSLSLCNKSEIWLNNILKKERLQLKDIFIMTAEKSGNYKVIKKEKKG